MKVLFVSAEGSDGQPRNVVKNQGESLKKEGVEVHYFCMRGRGIRGYLKSVPQLRQEFRKINPDLVHAHYSLSGIVASLARVGPLVVSLMGSDANMGPLQNTITRYFVKSRWQRTIVKSADMKVRLRINKAEVVPNGVDTELFTPLDIQSSAKRVGFDSSCFNILFVSDPARPEKNFRLAQKAISFIGNEKIILHPVHEVVNSEMPFYYCGSNLLLLTSIWEGSPNSVKEAMSCNLPVVATRVGDVEQLLDGVEGCHIISFNAHEVAEDIKTVLQSGERANGRDKIFSLGLDSKTVAKKITAIYYQMI